MPHERNPKDFMLLQSSSSVPGKKSQGLYLSSECIKCTCSPLATVIWLHFDSRGRLCHLFQAKLNTIFQQVCCKAFNICMFLCNNLVSCLLATVVSIGTVVFPSLLRLLFHHISWMPFMQLNFPASSFEEKLIA